MHRCDREEPSELKQLKTPQSTTDRSFDAFIFSFDVDGRVRLVPFLFHHSANELRSVHQQSS